SCSGSGSARPRIGAVNVSSASPRPAVASDAPEGTRSRPLLTVVVPVYNGGDDVVANIGIIHEAVAACTPREPVELVAGSDGSMDGTAERLLETREQGLRVIHYDRNLGKGYAVKSGALASHGSWVALIDADLDLDPASIPTYLAKARDEELDFVIGSK